QALDGAALAEGAVEDRQDDVDDAQGVDGVAPGDGDELDARPVAVRDRAPLELAELPLSVALDLDRRGLVALRVEPLEHRARRGDRDRVLARAPAHEHGDADTGLVSHGPGVVVVVDGVDWTCPP